MFKKFVIFVAVIVGANLANACPAGLRLFNKELGGKQACVLEGTYVGVLELTSAYNYILLGDVWIGSEKRDADQTLKEPRQAGELVINPGVSVFALNPSKDTTGVWKGFTTADGVEITNALDVKSFLSVTRDSQIIVRGTESAPVYMTSAQGEHQALGGSNKQPGDWGGLVISGQAKSNRCVNGFDGCTIPGEAGTGWYGGNDDNHSSGVIQYLQVEYGGDRIDAKKELNGITFNAVGLGTLIENIAVLYNSDDCVEFFGGAVTGRNIFCYKGEDDGIDTTDGARIFLQNGIVVAADFPDAGEKNDRHMLEADSSKNDASNQLLRSHPVLVNFSFVGGVNSQGLKLRRGTNYTLVNSIMVGVDRWCLDPNGAQDLLFSTNLFGDCGVLDPIQSLAGTTVVPGAQLMMDGWIPQVGSPVLSGAEIMEEFFAADADLDEAFFDVYEEVEYMGAMGDEDWTSWIQTRD